MNPNLYRELAEFLQPHTHNEVLQNAVKTALIGTPALYQLVTQTSAQDFVTNLLITLDNFGNIAEGRPAIVAVLEALSDKVGVNKQTEIEHLIARIHEDAKTKRDTTTSRGIVYSSPPTRLPITGILVLVLVIGLGLIVATALPTITTTPTENRDALVVSPTTSIPQDNPSTAVPTPIPTAKLLLQEDFEDGTAEELRPNPWTDWEVVTENDGNHAYLGRPSWVVQFGAADWSDYGFSVRFKPLVYDRFFAIGFRAQNFMSTSEQHYFVSFDPALGLSLQRADNSNDWPRLVNRNDFKVNVNEWNTLWVEAKGTEIKVRCNDVEFSTFDYQLQKGSLYFVIHGDQNKDQTIILFDDLLVWALDP